MIYTSIANIKPAKEDGKYITSEFVGLTKYFIMQELFSINALHNTKFGDIVICLDKSSDGYWRKDFYPGYKAGRKKGREESEINFSEVFKEIDELIDQINLNLPWKVIAVPKAEADDIMLVLAKEYSKYENILIHSPDKDMIQAQRDTDNVFQYSSLTKKWLVPENKHENMDEWVLEHVCLGDAADEVPKVVDHTEFSDNFLEYLKENGYNISSPHEFKVAGIPDSDKRKLIMDFDIEKTNRKGEPNGIKDIYRDIRFGPSTLKKEIKKHGSLDAWLDSHPMYRNHYERNFKLVMTEGIPTDIWNNIILTFKTAKNDYNPVQFEEYLNNNNLKTLLLELPQHFKIERPLSVEDFGW
jgi:5'-3' exonuclease